MLQVNVAQLHEDNREALSLTWLAGREGRTAVRRESAAAAALIGHLNLTHPNSVQVIGAYEAGTIAGLADRLGQAARARVQDHYLGDRHLAQYADLFERLSSST